MEAFNFRFGTLLRKFKMNYQNQGSTPLVWEIAKLQKFLVTLLNRSLVLFSLTVNGILQWSGRLVSV